MREASKCPVYWRFSGCLRVYRAKTVTCAVTCSFLGTRDQAMIADHAVSTAVSDLGYRVRLARAARPQHCLWRAKTRYKCDELRLRRLWVPNWSSTAVTCGIAGSGGRA
jgi:hypothetical protein